MNFKENNLDNKIKGKIARMLAYIYIDDADHISYKTSRVFKAYGTSNNNSGKLLLHSLFLASEKKSSQDDEKLKELINYINENIKNFKDINDESFHYEFIRLLNYLIRFRLFEFSEDDFQNKFGSKVFNYLCYMCDIFTGQSSIESMHSLDKIISKDTILTDASRSNPFQKAAYDVKFTLFNIKYSTNENFHIKILREIVTVFHLFLDLRQDHLMLNNIKFFHNEVFLKYKDKIKMELTNEENEEIEEVFLKKFKCIIPDSDSISNSLNYELLDINVKSKPLNSV